MEDKGWDISSYNEDDDYLSPPREESAEIRKWGGGKLKVQPRLLYALDAALEAKVFPQCQSKTALHRLGLTLVLKEWARLAKDPVQSAEAINLMKLLQAEDLPELIKADERLVEKIHSLAGVCVSSYQRDEVVVWAKATVDSMADPAFKHRFQREIIRLENRAFDC